MSISKSPNMPFKTKFFVNWLELYITHKRSLPITLPREAPSLPMAGRVRACAMTASPTRTAKHLGSK